METLTIDQYLAELESEGWQIKADESLSLRSDASGAVVDSGTNKFILTISTVDKDRGNDILNPEGVELKNFQLAPLFLWEHGRDPMYPKDSSVIGYTHRIITNKTSVRAGVTYIPLSSNPLPARILEMEQKGLVPGNSIGWRPSKVSKDSAGVRHVERWELLHVSKVLHPMNGRAVTHAKIG